MGKTSRFYAIDLLRFIGAFLVLLFHYTFRGFASDNYNVLEYSLLGSFFKYGYLGVDLFFMISGFVILMSAYNKTAREFVIARMVRLYPAFWFCCSLTYITIMVLGGSRFDATFKQFLVNLTLINNFFGVNYIDGVYWSLTILIEFYFFVFLIILFRQMSNIKYYVGVWLTLILIGSGFHTKYINAFVMPQYAAYFISGVTFYIIYLEGISTYKIILIAASYIHALMQSHNELVSMEKYYHTDFSFYVTAVIILLFYLILLFISTAKSAFLRSTKYLLLGGLTYPMYLLHQKIGYMIFNSLSTHVNKYAILLGVIIAMLILSHLVHTRIEKLVYDILRDSFDKLYHSYPNQGFGKNRPYL